MVNNHTSYRGVQALRGLAALSVMLFHFRWNLNAVTPALGDRLFGWGASGVDLFFLISGFVITLSIKRKPSGISGAVQFLKQRALRILPAYYIILLISFLVSGAMSTFHYADKTENLISALLFKPIYADHPPFYVNDSGMYGIRWTLNYEVYFYLCMSLMVIFSKRWLMTGLFFLASLVVVPLCLWGTWTVQTAGYKTSSALLGLVTNPIIWLFLTGVAIGLILPCLQKIPSHLNALFLMLSLVMGAYYFSYGRFTGHGIMESGWLYALILAFAIGAEKVIRGFIPEALVKLGNISFSLYLIHTLFNNGLGKRIEALGVEPGWGRLILSAVLSLVLSWLSWRFIESYFVKKRSSEVRGRINLSEGS